MTRPRNRVERALTGKLRMRLDEGRDHRFYELWIDDQFVLQTKISTGGKYRDLSDPLLAQIAKQLRVSRRQLNELIDCPMSSDDYVEYLRQSGHL